MGSRKQFRILYDGMLDIPTSLNGISVLSYDLDHLGKTNHKISVSFTVLHINQSNTVDDIRLYVLSRDQFVTWALNCLRNNNAYLCPVQYSHYSGQVPSGQVTLQVHSGGSLHFLLDNRYSTFSSKRVAIRIDEEWEEQTGQLDLVTTIPPHDRSLEDEAKRMICNCNHTLKIISPYADMSFVKDILEKSKSANIQIITRARDEFTSDKRQAFGFIKDNLKDNHRINNFVHSRIIIRDNEEALISSADLTQDGLMKQYNTGAIISDANVMRKLLKYFDEVWHQSTTVQTKAK
ncbi:phosphatidylserine/phosphatidylglycerophosphate/cardiolipin synthase [Candidatus Nitrososphaera evergladensis SR1]|uniref:Phosphatidylserine/phosphatidylglycerophosphate/ cardiolipin synthase n=1 Tax=Candidatus Nitrososphaera evergladensis SR1 TaxID=1459636 RepID=A0A075MSP6_9ARCH|nr:phospholipase D-like domain-containing protein [Candidatus Nitrososphaera evergladensis]AIF82374.1 phosphatidylserine/phosphatidylglycerophosphate/cardiolipin synthase [Candidatus Nitrososphaera evergladensis SR1]AIF83209.1 phosphatidylserine/phosphatidylglycerophosphate/cardiolipin synthase [Candidatus Nitrososphaera evergladensis SR1]